MISVVGIGLFVGFVLRLIFVVFVADFIVGFVHWLEDRYGQEDWPLLGRTVIAPNLLHHDKPREFLKNSWWGSADYQVIASALFIAVAAFYGFLIWEIVAVLTLAINGNEVHKWAHRSKKENGPIITYMQKRRIIQSRAQHGRHHGGDRDSHYCSLTSWVNPLFDRTKFWRGLEWVIWRLTGVNPRIDPVVAARKAL